jgi:hypothetical protein
MVDSPDVDALLMLDMLLAAGDARGFLGGLDEAAFMANWSGSWCRSASIR